MLHRLVFCPEVPFLGDIYHKEVSLYFPNHIECLFSSSPQFLDYTCCFRVWLSSYSMNCLSQVLDGHGSSTGPAIYPFPHAIDPFADNASEATRLLLAWSSKDNSQLHTAVINVDKHLVSTPPSSRSNVLINNSF
jgi:hypothetical protein